MSQLGIFDPPPPRHRMLFEAASRGVDTSVEAAASLDRTHLARLRREVLSFFGSRGERGATPDEVAEHFDCAHNTTSPRVTELAQLGYIVRTNERRKTRSGRAAGVYRIVDRGRRELEP